ncbi:MacS family sensor histidine kinase [Nocardia carnea]|uniref:MacS family sensor histidine kinase n=1 Tax=Nocardia carnea TaxID=37328 RepID=UPI0024546C0A|nr:DUF5931 domain-containing protein [Nocardia carnea]
MATTRSPRVSPYRAPDPADAATAPLWRAVQAFRLVTLLYAVGQQIASVQYYQNQLLSWFFIALMVIWSGLSALLLTSPRTFGTARTRTLVVLGDHIVVLGLVAATPLVADYDWYHGHQPLPTTMWSANAVISAAILRGPLAGVASGLLIAATIITMRQQWGEDVWADATAPVLVSVGLALGLAANTARRAQEQLQRAVRLTAAAEERERLARQVHDGVLQILSYISRRGSEIGGPALELADRAAEQEVALRRLVSEQAAQPDNGDTTVDLRPQLIAHATPRVVVSTPGEPVRVGRWTAQEITAAVTAALTNVERHAGTDARAYVLLEDTGTELVVSVRDDGIGIPPGRLAEAENEGRMGVSRSITGRIAALGGTAELLTADIVGEGTEWEFHIPYA